MTGLFDAVTFLFADYAQAISAGIIALSLTSIIFRILWDFR